MLEMTRRSFIQTMLALGIAPSIVRASSIMRVRPLLVTSVATDMIVLEDGFGGVIATLKLISPALTDYPGLFPYPARWRGIVEHGGSYRQATLRHHDGQMLLVTDLAIRTSLLTGDTVEITGLNFRLTR